MTSKMVRLNTTEIQIQKFANKSIGNKPVSEVPGIGPKLKKILGEAGFLKAADLYNKLDSFNFDEKKFRVWMTLNVSKHARVPTIYKALHTWSMQFGGRGRRTETVGDEPESSRTDARPVSGRRRCTPVARRRRSSVQYNVHKREASPNNAQIDVSHNSMDDDSPLRQGLSQPSYQLMQYLKSFSTTFMNIPEEFHKEFRRDILSLAEKYEDITKSKEMPYEPQPSTSS